MRFLNLSSLLLCISLFSLFHTPTFAIKKSYVVYLGSHSHGPNPTSSHMERATNSHHEFLGSFLGSKEKAKESIFYSYNKHINGFAATFEEELAKEMEKHPKVMSIFENKLIQLHTTRSWEYLRLEKGGEVPLNSLWKKANFGEDIIIANIDSGVWPECESFGDEGFGPVPSKWRGACDSGRDNGFKCNRKLIGARHFSAGFKQMLKDINGTVPETFFNPRDTIGHGTHTLATAGGNFVANASILGNGNGTMKGGAPNARVAAYKAGWTVPSGETGSDPSDVIAAFDAAIYDGVDVISASIGYAAEEYFKDAIAIGSFHAIKQGVIVISSAGNSGPDPNTMENEAPWMVTVAAGTIDRNFVSNVTLGNGKQLQGASLSNNSLPSDKYYPMIDGLSAKLPNATDIDAMRCDPGALDTTKTKGKVIVCIAVAPKKEVAKDIGLATAHEPVAPTSTSTPYIAMILVNDNVTNNFIRAQDRPLPFSNLNFTDGETLFAYMKTIPNPVATVGPSKTEFNIKPTPMVAQFSSRGPNNIQTSILKPDVIAPGVDIIAPYLGPHYKALSGTSMSAPHVAGICALLRKIHPGWSPSAIKSAIMTTASTKDGNTCPILDQATNLEATPLHYGSGQVRPDLADDPGLVYDLIVDDYLNFLCAHGYDEKAISTFYPGQLFACPKSFSMADFNYPSITVPNLIDPLNITRKLKNVGTPGTYNVTVEEPAGVSVQVEPTSLTFGIQGEENTFTVVFKRKDNVKLGKHVFGGLTWSDGSHHVRSPIAVLL